MLLRVKFKCKSISQTKNRWWNEIQIVKKVSLVELALYNDQPIHDFGHNNIYIAI